MCSKKLVDPDCAEVKKLNMMKEKDVEAVKNQVKDWLQQSECPFTTSLCILKKSIYKNCRKRSLCKIVANQLQSYNNEQFTCSEGVKKRTADSLGGFNVKNKNILLKALGFDQQDPLFEKKVSKTELAKKEEIKEFLTNHKIENNDIAEKVIVPILTNDNKFNAVLKYVGDSKETRIRVIEAVDKLVSEILWIENTIIEEKYIKKLLVFLENLKEKIPTAYFESKTNNFDEVVLKKANKNVNIKNKEQKWKIVLYIRYLIKHWKNNQITGGSLESLIFRYVGNDSYLIKKVTRQIEKYFKDKVRADLFRQSLQPGSERAPIWSDEEEIPIQDHELKLAIPFESVFFVDTEERLVECLNYFKENEPSDGELLPIGFDAEWIRSPADDQNNLALIQFAVKDRVYLIDFAHFWKENCQVIAKLVQYVFCSKNFAVLGFGIDSDKKVFEKYFAGRIWTENTVDFLKSRNCQMFLECGKDSELCLHIGKQLKGLSRLCQQVVVFM